MEGRESAGEGEEVRAKKRYKERERKGGRG